MACSEVESGVPIGVRSDMSVFPGEGFTAVVVAGDILLPT